MNLWNWWRAPNCSRKGHKIKAKEIFLHKTKVQTNLKISTKLVKTIL